MIRITMITTIIEITIINIIIFSVTFIFENKVSNDNHYGISNNSKNNEKLNEHALMIPQCLLSF